MSEDISKLQKRISLLKEEYVKLQQRLLEVEKTNELLSASDINNNRDSFPQKLLHFVANLYNNQEYSDILIKLSDGQLKGHKFVFESRGGSWSLKDNVLDVSDLPSKAVEMMVRWVYSGDLHSGQGGGDEGLLVDLLHCSHRFQLHPLKNLCEQSLLVHIQQSNCLQLYQTADDTSSSTLKQHSFHFIQLHWDNFWNDDLSCLTASTAYQLFKQRSSYPLHLSIRTAREDVLFLFLMEYHHELAVKLNETDDLGDLAVDLALSNRHLSIAKVLVEHKVDLDRRLNGKTLLHTSILRGDQFSSEFLIGHGCDLNLQSEHQNESALHLLATLPTCEQDNVKVASLILSKGGDANLLDAEKRTALHRSIHSNNHAIFHLLINHTCTNLNIQDNAGHPPIWNALSINHTNPTPTPVSLKTTKNTNDTTYTNKITLNYSNDDDDNDEDNDNEDEGDDDEGGDDDDFIDHHFPSSSFASRLVEKGCSLDLICSSTGNTLLHEASISHNQPAALFLLKHHALPNILNLNGESILHTSTRLNQHRIVRSLLRHGADVNIQTLPPSLPLNPLSSSYSNSSKSTPNNAPPFNFNNPPPSSISDNSQSTTNSYNSSLSPTANHQKSTNANATHNSFSNEISTNKNSASPTTTTTFKSDDSTTTIHHQTSLHIALRHKHHSLIKLFLSFDLSSNTLHSNNQSINSQNNSFNNSLPNNPSSKNPLSENNHTSTNTPSHTSELNLTLKDSTQLTTLALSLLVSNLRAAKWIVDRGGVVDEVDEDGWWLVHKAIGRMDMESAEFLISNGACVSHRSPDDKSCMELCIEADLPSVLDQLCLKDPSSIHQPISHPTPSNHSFSNSTSSNSPNLIASNQPPLSPTNPFFDPILELSPTTNTTNTTTNNTPTCLLWKALDLEYFEVASVLVKHGHDLDCWFIGSNSNDYQQTLLHHAMDANKQKISCFLIKNNCDIASPRRPVFDGKMGEEASDGKTPVHLSSSWGLVEVVRCLMAFGADVNKQDSEGNTPLHIAIKNHHDEITTTLLTHPTISLTIRDNKELTAFGTCLNVKNHKAGGVIVAKDPSTAEQKDSKGRSLLHTTVQSDDLEGVLFLIGANVTVCTCDVEKVTPLHVSVTVGSEMILRNLLLAGADVNAPDHHSHTPLHVAAATNHPHLVSILLDHHAKPDLLDESLNNALHLACQHGNVSVVRVLLTQSKINATVLNNKSRTPLHILAHHCKDNSSPIFNLLTNTHPIYPVDWVDEDGNSALLLAYINGNSSLCKAIVKFGACLGSTNTDGLSIFNVPVATKQLLTNLLDLLEKEPRWSEGDECMECHVKFRITTRKHHCRSCGRLLCSRCSTHETPILKFKLSRPVRTCTVCFTFITTGTLQ